MHAVAYDEVAGPTGLLFAKLVPLADDYVGRGFFVSLKGTVWTRGTEDYGHNGVVKLLRERDADRCAFRRARAPARRRRPEPRPWRSPRGYAVFALTCFSNAAVQES